MKIIKYVYSHPKSSMDVGMLHTRPKDEASVENKYIMVGIKTPNDFDVAITTNWMTNLVRTMAYFQPSCESRKPPILKQDFP